MFGKSSLTSIMVLSTALLFGACTVPDGGIVLYPPIGELDEHRASLTHEADLAVMAQDGTRLSAHAFYTPPEGLKDLEPRPVILAFTPYSIPALLPRARFFAANGYVFVAVSARGRGDSEGEFAPFSERDGQDAADAIAWASEQQWSNGQVGMWGGSYLGYSQWAALGHKPPALKTIVPAAAVYPGIDYPAWDEVNLTYQFQWLAALQGRLDWFETAFDDAAWAEATHAQRRDGSSFADLAKRSGARREIAEQWLTTEISEWQKSVPSDAALSETDIPVLSITGQFDSDQRGALAYHRRLEAAHGGAFEHGYVLIGPWDHGGTRTPRKIQAGQIVDDGSVIDMNALHLAWYDWILKDGPKPVLLPDHFNYFVLDTGEWKSAESITAVDDGITLHLGTNEYGAQTLADAPIEADFRYTLDTRTAGLVNPIGFEQLPGDVRDLDVLNTDGLVFDAAPLEQPMDLVGLPRFSAWVSTSRPDGDVFASLLVIDAEGHRTRVGFDVVRLRHETENNRDANDRLVADPQIGSERYIHVHFDKLGFVARRLDVGDRLQLALHSNPPKFIEMNFGGGGVVAHETIADGGEQIITIRQNPDMPATLFLPLKLLPIIDPQP